MTAPEHANVCGLCGQPLDERHADDTQHGVADKRGETREYVVVGRRGGIADYQRVGDAVRTRRTDAAMLAVQLGIEESRLVGARFSCWVEPAEYGVFESDFTLIS